MNPLEHPLIWVSEFNRQDMDRRLCSIAGFVLSQALFYHVRASFLGLTGRDSVYVKTKLSHDGNIHACNDVAPLYGIVENVERTTSRVKIRINNQQILAFLFVSP